MSKTNVKVGSYTITDMDVDSFIASLPREQQMYRDDPAFRKQCEERLEEICLFAMLGEEEKQDETEEYKTAINAAKRDILGQLAMAKLLRNVEANEEEMKKYFEENKESFSTPATATAKHILVSEEAKANDIKEMLQKGEKTFEEAAKEFSSCPSSAKGGNLGTFGKGQMVKEFEEAVFEGDIETIIGPVKTPFGYHLIWVDSKSESGIPEYETVADKVRSTVIHYKQERIYEDTLESLREKYIG